ncbi:MAG: DMT family transporter [Acidiferrobacterales bacterium]|nr:DMT family transporter [Acidiferrobacterales bacterium]
MRNHYKFGLSLILLGGTFLSLSGILLRHIESASGWQILFYRSLTCFIFIATVLAFQYRKTTVAKFKAIGLPGLGASLTLSIGSIFYIMAMLNTTVANVVFIIGASPLVAALAGWLFLKEKVSLMQLLTMLLAVLGIGLMFADGFVSGGMLGNVLALMMVFMYVIYLLILRKNRHIDMLPATCLSGLVTAMIVLPFVGTLAISNQDLLISLLLGSVQFGMGFMLLTWSTRYLLAAEVALFSLSESILNPIWVWIGVNEVPSNLTLAGSAVVLFSVIVYSVMALKKERSQKL